MPRTCRSRPSSDFPIQAFPRWPVDAVGRSAPPLAACPGPACFRAEGGPCPPHLLRVCKLPWGLKFARVRSAPRGTAGPGFFFHAPRPIFPSRRFRFRIRDPRETQWAPRNTIWRPPRPEMGSRRTYSGSRKLPLAARRTPLDSQSPQRVPRRELRKPSGGVPDPKNEALVEAKALF